jgi:anti-anti-sigma regulatory factor
LEIISEKESIRIVVFDFQWMNNIDSSGYVVLKNMTEKLESA